jgi:hypothetical protein
VTYARDTHREGRPEEIAAALRAEWRMIASVVLRPSAQGDGFEAALRLDPVVVRGSLEQQGYPRTPDAMTKIERRRNAALDECVQRVNRGLGSGEQIKSFLVLS